MRFLHTADWHIGKSLRGRSRMDEHEKALQEVFEIAVREKIDCVLVAGDIFDTQAPPAEAERLVYSLLADLAGHRIPAVLIGGNHDHPRRLEALRPLLDRMSIHMRPTVRAPEEGGVVELTVRGEQARIAVMPWVPEHKWLDASLLMGVHAERSSAYAEGITSIVDALSAGFTAETVNVLLGHLFVQGGEATGSEREVHTTKPYALPAQRFPDSASYIALGHLHRPQEIAGPSPIFYSGSLLQLDFGEYGQDKRVVIIDAKAGKTARVESVRLAGGRRLRHVSGTLAEIEKRAAEWNNGDFLYVTVQLAKPKPGVAEDVRAMLPDAVDVRVDLPGPPPPGPAPPPSDPRAMFQRFFEDREGGEPLPDLMSAFQKLYEEATDASSEA
ncbi:MAG: exonuclease SbcCD subunit D [Bryobacterales bacterium]|nr:exonuclease SbcCD subunit D [Bryobacterales bacterium]